MYIPYIYSHISHSVSSQPPKEGVLPLQHVDHMLMHFVISTH